MGRKMVWFWITYRPKMAICFLGEDESASDNESINADEKGADDEMEGYEGTSSRALDKAGAGNQDPTRIKVNLLSDFALYKLFLFRKFAREQR